MHDLQARPLSGFYLKPGEQDTVNDFVHKLLALPPRLTHEIQCGLLRHSVLSLHTEAPTPRPPPLPKTDEDPLGHVKYEARLVKAQGALVQEVWSNAVHESFSRASELQDNTAPKDRLRVLEEAKVSLSVQPPTTPWVNTFPKLDQVVCIHCMDHPTL